MSAPQFRTAHTGCDECEAVVTSARAYIAAGGRLSGRWGSSVRDEHSPHWAEHITAPAEEAPALAEVPVTNGGALPKKGAASSPWEMDRQTLLEVALQVAALGRVEVQVRVGDNNRPALVESSEDPVHELSSRLERTSICACGAEPDCFDVDELADDRQLSRVITVSRDDANWATSGRRLAECLEVARVHLGHPIRVSVELDGSDDESRSHDASPSAGEGAEPGLASTLSVGGERAAGARNEEAPAAAPTGRYSRSINPAALRSIRELAGVRSGDLARAAGISPPFLSNIEAGRKTPSPTVLHALAQRLGVPIDAITQTT